MAASATEPVRLSSWAFQNWTILLSGSFFRAGVEVLDGRGDVAPLERELAVEEVGGGGFLPPRLDLGDRGGRGLEVVLLQLELGELDQGRGVVGPVGEVARSSRASLDVLSRSARIWARISVRLDVVGVVGQESA